MKVAILAGGAGTRLMEETSRRPKPMIEIGGRPMLWHIMMHYAAYRLDDFVIALGYKGEQIKKYMLDYCALCIQNIAKVTVSASLKIPVSIKDGGPEITKSRCDMMHLVRLLLFFNTAHLDTTYFSLLLSSMTS